MRTPIDVPTIEDMTLEEQEELLLGIRDRRLTVLRAVKDAKQIQEKLTKSKLTGQRQKKIELCEKRLESADRAYEKAEEYIRAIRQIDLMLEIL